MRRLLQILISLCLPALAAAQGTRFDANNVTSATNVPFGSQSTLYTLPFSKVTVCAYPDDGGQPCGNVIPIYSNPALTQQADNAITADVHGRFGFWLAPGTYTYSVVTQGGQFVGTYIFTLGGTSSGGCTFLTPAGDGQFTYSFGSGCASSPNISVINPTTSQTPLAAANVFQVQGHHNGGIYNNFTQLFGDQIFVQADGAAGNYNGVGVNLHLSDVHQGSFGGFFPIPLVDVDGFTSINLAGNNSVNFKAEPDVSNVAANTIVEFESTAPVLGAGSVNNLYHFEAVGVGSKATVEEFAFYANPVATSNIHANYCDFMARTQEGSPVTRASIGCGSGALNTFAGNIIAPMYQETLTTPASSSAACTAGQFTDDANFHYVCVSSNVWKRVALSSF